LIATTYLDLPPSNGLYRFAVTASRRGAESPVSANVIALSDRTAPNAPTNVTAQLVSNGIRVGFTPDTGGEAAARFNIYRNGVLIRTVVSAAPVIDVPPRGTHPRT
jgi:hypothetical protein